MESNTFKQGDLVKIKPGASIYSILRPYSPDNPPPVGSLCLVLEDRASSYSQVKVLFEEKIYQTKKRHS